MKTLFFSLLFFAARAGAALVITEIDPAAGTLSWTGGLASAWVTLEYTRGDGTFYGDWSAIMTATNNGAYTQQVRTPIFYRITMTDDAQPDAGLRTAVSPDWSLVTTGNGIVSFGNLDSTTDYALAWSTNSQDYYTGWGPFRAQAANASGSLPLPGVWGVFRTSPLPIVPVGFRLIPGRTVSLGSSSGRYDEVPPHQVSVDSYLLAATETTEAQWDSIRNWGISTARVVTNQMPYAAARRGTNYPVTAVSWLDSVYYLNLASQAHYLEPCYTISPDGSVSWDTAADGYRFPTEDEWEKAAKGINETAYPFGDSARKLWPTGTDSAGDYIYSDLLLANIRTSAFFIGGPVPVSSYRWDGWNNAAAATDPSAYKSSVALTADNGFGVYDLSGNVAEWCWDWYAGGQTAPTSGTRRVIKGGTWFDLAEDVRAARRFHLRPETRNRAVGVRAARNAITKISARNIAIVTNTNSTDSITLRDLVLSDRFPGALQVDISCSNTLWLTSEEDATNIVDQIVAAVTNTPVQYIVCLKDVPWAVDSTRYNGGTNDYQKMYDNIQYRIANALGVSPANQKWPLLTNDFPVITHITGPTLASCTAYVHRVSANMSTSSLLVSGGLTNDVIIADDCTASYPAITNGTYAALGTNALARMYAPPTNVIYNADGGSFYTNATPNVSAWMSWGKHGYGNDTWVENVSRPSSWFAVTPIESYCGQMGNHHSGPDQWFASGAFGGAAFENCPVGAAGYVQEPMLGGVINPSWMELWQAGLPWADVAWRSRNSIHQVVFGDPLVTR